MNTIALENLKIINDYNKNYYLISDNNQLSLIQKDDYDPVNRLDSLEYPIFFDIQISAQFIFHDLLKISTGLKPAMKGLDISEIPDDQMLQERGW